MIRSSLKLALIAASFLAVASGESQTSPAPPTAPIASPALAEIELDARLAALDGTDANAYFELAEEVAQDREDGARVALARTLYVLAFHLDRTKSGQRIAAASCIALADLATSERDRRWLSSIADTLDTRRYRPDWVRRAEEAASGQTAYLAATALGLVRSGDGVAARQVFDEPGVRPLIQKYERMLAPDSESGFTRFFEREAGKWPCPECHNARIVRKTGSGKDAQYRLCTNCEGTPGPELSTSGLIAQLRFESVLLAGIQRSWSAQVAADGGTPLRDPDPDEVAKVFGVDVSKPRWHAGQWVAPPAPASPPRAPAPGQ